MDGKQPPPALTCFLNCVQDMKCVRVRQPVTWVWQQGQIMEKSYATKIVQKTEKMSKTS